MKFIIENIPGASSTLAAMQTLRADPDGHTLFLGSSSSQSIAPAMLKLSYDPLTAFAPISQMTSTPSIVAVSRAYGVTSWSAFVDKARKERDGTFYATSNVGFQLPAVQIEKATGIKLVNIPFKGGGEAVMALLGGSVPLVIGTPPTILPHVASGDAVALCVTSAQRSPIMPEIPGTEEIGLTGVNSVGWFGLFARATTPRSIINDLHRAIQTAIQDKDLGEALAKEGNALQGSESPEAFAAFQKDDYERTGTLLREAGLALR